MTLVLNRLLPLSGNKWLLLVTISVLLAACSPKLRPVVTVPKPVDTIVKKPVDVKVIAPQPPPTAVISLLLPFYLDELDLSKGASKSGLTKADLALQYYQGFKLALDSLSANPNNNFKLQVFDTRDATAQAHNLALNTKVRTSGIVIGPIYPEEVKSFTQATVNMHKILVSPLSPASPADYKNPDLVTVIPPLEYHCRLVAGYIANKLKAKKVFVLKSGYSDDNKYSVPFDKIIDSMTKKRIKIVEVTILRGDLSALLPQLSTTEQNIFVIPATDQQFVQVTLQALDKLTKQHYPVTLFGHPNWEDATYLKADLLQRLNTYITSGDRVNYHSPKVTKFLRAYRKAYRTEPGEYAIKAFDEGMYFGQLAISQAYARQAANNKQNPLVPAKAVLSYQDFEGLHNTFHFTEVPGLGFVNTHVKLYQYANFELKPVE
jgi:hypothetical protein